LTLQEFTIDENDPFRFNISTHNTDGPHFWYLAIANCDHDIDMDVDLQLINSGSGWLKQFSNDEQGWF
jgi:hypothetical protein